MCLLFPSLDHLGSLSEIGIAISSDTISSGLVNKSFSNTNLLRNFGQTIPKGIMGYLRFKFSPALFRVTYHSNTFIFDVVDGTLSTGDFLKLFPHLNVPAGIKDILDLRIGELQFNIITQKIIIKVDFNGVLNFLSGILPIQAPSIVLTVDMSVDNIIGEIVGKLNISKAIIPVHVRYNHGIHRFEIATNFRVPSVGIGEVFSFLRMPPPSVPDMFSFPGLPISLEAEFDGLSKGILVVGTTINK